MRRCLIAGFVIASLLVVVTLLRYPGTAVSTPRYLALGASSLVALLVIGGWIVSGSLTGAHPALERAFPFGLRTVSVDAAKVTSQGARVGALLGVLWVIEISFNNLPPSDISTPAARFLVDNGIWAAISLATIALGGVSAFRDGRIVTGIRAGLWSGLVSGLIACLMAMLLVVFGMRFLARDPLAIAEYAERGLASGAPDLITYLAYETMTGAMGHLLFIGIAMGALLGALGGIVGAYSQRVGIGLRGTSRR